MKYRNIVFLAFVKVIIVVIELDCWLWTKFSEAKPQWGDLKEMHALHDISPFGYYACQIIDAMEREYSKT